MSAKTRGWILTLWVLPSPLGWVGHVGRPEWEDGGEAGVVVKGTDGDPCRPYNLWRGFIFILSSMESH